MFFIGINLLTDDALCAFPHSDDVLCDREVVVLTDPFSRVQETEGWKVTQLIRSLTKLMTTYYPAETFIGCVVENSARRLYVSLVLASSYHRRLICEVLAISMAWNSIHQMKTP